jgi:hypothetical protein
MRGFRKLILPAFMTLAAWQGTANSSQADTGTVRVLFAKAGVVAAVGNGKGELTFQGNKYPFEFSGASFGATVGLSVSELVGSAMNLRAPGDLAGSYTAVGAGAALGGGVGGVRLQNANGVVLVLHGPQLGVELSASLARITITMN